MTFKSFIYIFIDLIEMIIPVIVSLALLTFVWGLVKFILNVSGDEKVVTEGKNLMIWGLIALFIMISIWGILSLMTSEAGLGPFVVPLLPER